MAKKFFDIIPAQKEQTIRKPIIEEKNKMKKNNKKIIYLIFGFCFFVLIGLFIFSFSSAVKIEIIPQMSILEIEQNINLDQNINNSIYATRTIAVKEISDSAKESQEFLATGKAIKQERASGIIRVYNNHSNEPQSLLPETRFISADGVLFRSVQREVIPGGVYEGGKLVQSYLDIEVIAGDVGPEYNIGPSTFSIPGFAGTAKYTTFYGKSFESMTGGTNKEASQITQADLNEAENQLLERVKQKATEKLLEKVSIDFSLIKPLIEYEILRTDFSAQVGDIQDSFVLEIEAQATGFIFKQSEMMELVKMLADQELIGKLIKPGSLDINYEIKDEIKAIFSFKIYSEMNLTDLKKRIMSLTKTEAINALEEKEEILQATIKSWFFLTKRVPEDLDKIDFVIKVD